MTLIQQVIEERNITEILHFTTNVGLLGVLATKAILSRKRLPMESYLEHVYTPNCSVRRDTQWLDYVNLSISSINNNLFDISSGAWHRNRDVWWCVLSFDPIILNHDGVVFTSTNNMYSNAVRSCGLVGLQKMFSPVVSTCTRSSVIQIQRPHDLLPKYPTCPQAEILYPGSLSIEYLKRVYVLKQDFEYAICGQCAALSLPPIEVSVNNSIFRGTRG